MTIFAVNVAALEENGSSVSRTVYTAERNDSIYNGFHQRTFLQDMTVLEAPSPRPVVFWRTACP